MESKIARLVEETNKIRETGETKILPDGTTEVYDTDGQLMRKYFPDGTTEYYKEDGITVNIIEEGNFLKK